MRDPHGLWCGVVVKQQNFDYNAGEMGHRWIDGGGPSFGWWPVDEEADLIDWYLGTEGEGKSPDPHVDDTDYEMMWVTRRKLTGTMLYGLKAGTSCKCIQDCGEVRSCLEHFRTRTWGIWAGMWGTGILMHETTLFVGDCKRFADIVVDQCCLEKVLVLNTTPEWAWEWETGWEQ